MNEQIKQLVDQAWKQRELISASRSLDEAFTSKFAELIVRECSKVIVNGGYWSGGPLGPKRPCTPPEIAQMIKEHFGVEL